jgi:fatty-acyl-CoA synthase
MNGETNKKTTSTIPPAPVRRQALAANWPEWHPRTLAQHLDHVCQLHGSKPLLIADGRQYSYSEIQQWSIELAAGLLHLGIKPGDHVAVIMGNYPEYIALKFAIARLGAVAVAINYLLRRNELSYIFTQSDAKCLITMDSFADRDYLADLDELMPGWRQHSEGKIYGEIARVIIFSASGESSDGISLATLRKLGDPADRDEIDRIARLELATSNSDIVYTSGTTGTPKGVLLQHDMILRAAYASAYTSGFQPGWSILFSLPMYHVFGYVECLMACTFVGGTIIPHLGFDPAQMLSDAQRYQVSEIIAVPMMTLKLVELAKTQGFHCPSLAIVFNSGGASPPWLWQAIRDVLGAREVITAYGMSETTASTSCTFPEGDDRYLQETNGKLKFAGVAGDPELEGVLAVYKTIDPDTGEDLPPGYPGELLVKGPIVTHGYYKKLEETRAAIDNKGWLHTGDVGTVTADGYVILTGRIKETYRCGGEMVMPREVEDTLARHDAVRQAVVVGLPDPKMGEVGCACIISANEELPDTEALQRYCSENLAKFKVPKYFLFVDEAMIPMTATGRPQKFKLVELIQQQNLIKLARQ